MATIITGPVPDSAGQPADGRLEFRQVTAFNATSGSATQALAVADVRGGEIFALGGGEFSLPPNPSGTSVVIVEALRGRAAVRQVMVPEQASVAYMDLLPTRLDLGEVWTIESEDDPDPAGALPGDLLLVLSTGNLYRIGA